MSTVGATLLVLASAALHAAWNAALKRRKDPRAAAPAILAIAALMATLVALTQSRTAFPSPAALGWAIAAGVAEGLYFVSLGRAVADAPLGAAYAVSRGGSIALVWPASVALLGERARPLAAFGAIVIAMGLALIGAEAHSSPADASRGAGARRGLAWAAVSAVFIAAVYIAYKYALGARAEPDALFATSLCVGAPIGVAGLGARALPRLVAELRARPLVILAAGAACTASFLMFLGALEESGAGRVLTLRNTSVVFAYAFAWIAGERPGRVQLAGGVLVVAGAACLGAG